MTYYGSYDAGAATSPTATTRARLLQTGGSSTSKHPAALAFGTFLSKGEHKGKVREAYVQYLTDLNETGWLSPTPPLFAYDVAQQTYANLNGSRKVDWSAVEQGSGRRAAATQGGAAGSGGEAHAHSYGVGSTHPLRRSAPEDPIPRHNFGFEVDKLHCHRKGPHTPGHTGYGPAFYTAGHRSWSAHSGSRAAYMARSRGPLGTTANALLDGAGDSLYLGQNLSMNRHDVRRTDPQGDTALGQHAVPGSSTAKLVGSSYRVVPPTIRQWMV